MFAKRHSWMSARQRSSTRCWLQRLCVRIGETRQVVRSEITRPLNYWEGQYLLCEKRASCPTAPPDGAVCFSLFFLLRVFFFPLKTTAHCLSCWPLSFWGRPVCVANQQVVGLVLAHQEAIRSPQNVLSWLPWFPFSPTIQGSFLNLVEPSARCFAGIRIPAQAAANSIMEAADRAER